MLTLGYNSNNKVNESVYKEVTKEINGDVTNVSHRKFSIN